jgi:GNAT superfamily N-acetyltransferase
MEIISNHFKQASDQDALATMCYDCLQTPIACKDAEAVRRRWIAHYSDYLDAWFRTPERGIVIAYEGSPVGFGTYRALVDYERDLCILSLAEAGTTTEFSAAAKLIDLVCVAPVQQRRGVGRSILQRIEEDASLRGTAQLYGSCSGAQSGHGYLLCKTAGYVELASYPVRCIGDYPKTIVMKQISRV